MKDMPSWANSASVLLYSLISGKHAAPGTMVSVGANLSNMLQLFTAPADSQTSNLCVGREERKGRALARDYNRRDEPRAERGNYAPTIGLEMAPSAQSALTGSTIFRDRGPLSPQVRRLKMFVSAVQFCPCPPTRSLCSRSTLGGKC